MAHDDLQSELMLLYRAAGRPSYRRISMSIRADDTMRDTVSHETVSALLNEGPVPRWSKVEAVVRQLAKMAVHRPDEEAEVRRFLALWIAGSDTDPRADTRPAAQAGTSGVDDPAEPDAAGSPQPVPTGRQAGFVPPRNESFVGRDTTLDAIYARLRAPSWKPLVLLGLGGVGKSSIAVEYAYRHRNDYDVVWWLGAEQSLSTRQSFTALAERLGWPGGQDMRETIRTVLGRLENADFRWLLIFDNADDPEDLLPLLPAAGGDVLITSRNASWAEFGGVLAVDVMSRTESIALLQRRDRLSLDEADRLADRLGDLPLALEQAVALLETTGESVVDYLQRLDEQVLEVLSQGQPSAYPDTVASAFSLTYMRLRNESVAAAQLLAMLACLGSEPVTLPLLSIPSELIPPPLGRLLAQPEQLQHAVALLGRYGLVTLTEGGFRLQVHRLIQLIVRNSLSESDRQRAYANARRLLIGADPGDPEDPLSWATFEQIGVHIAPTHLVSDDNPAARRVVLDQIRYYYVLGDFDASLMLAEQARREWAGPRDIWDNESTFTALEYTARALLALGRHNEADQLLERVWDRLNAHAAFGFNHPLSIGMAGVVADARRMLGRYGEALRLDRSSVDALTHAQVPDERALTDARRRMTVSLRAVGRFAEARQIDEAMLDSQQTLHGNQHYETLIQTSNLAIDLQGLGRYSDSLTLQQEALPGLRSRLGTRHIAVLVARRNVAIGLRKVGRTAAALEESQELRLLTVAQLGVEHAQSLAAAVTYANTAREAAASGPTEFQGSLFAAYNVVTEAVNRYRRGFGERNPLTLAAAVNQAVILRLMGERIRARRTVEVAYYALYQQLGAEHPYTHAAAVGLANDFTTSGEQPEAIRLLRETLGAAKDHERETHPDVLAAAINLALLLRTANPRESETLLTPPLEALRQALGSDHRHVLNALRGERAECDIEPPPT